MQSSDSKCVINCDHDCTYTTYTKTVIWYGNITAQDFTLYSSLKKIALDLVLCDDLRQLKRRTRASRAPMHSFRSAIYGNAS